MRENKKKLIVAIAGLVLVVAVVVGLLLSRNTNPSGPSDNETPATTTEAPETNPSDETKSTENENDYTESSPAETEEPSTDDPEESSPAEESTESPESSSPVEESTAGSTEASTEESSTEVPAPAVNVTSVTVSAKASEYEYNYKLTKNDLTVTVKFSDDTSKTVTDYTIVQSGTNVYVTYKAVKSNVINITYKVGLVSISVETKNASYAYGTKLTKNDLTVTSKYSDGTEKLVENYTITQNNATLYVTAEGMKSNTITVKYISTVPNVLGKTFDQAKALLEQNGLKVLKVSKEEYSDTYAAGQVMLQSLASGATTNSGKTIYLTISKGKAPVLKSVSVTTNAPKYEYGYKLTKSDLTVTAKYSDNSTKEVTDYTITQSGTSLYVTFDDIKSGTITIAYEAVVVKTVTVSTKAYRYEYGYQLTKSDLTVTAKYSDNTSKTVTDYTITQNGTSLYVTFEGVKSSTITVVYKAPAVTSVTVATKASKYEYGYQLTKSDLSVTAKYADNTSKTVTDYTISQSGTSLYVTFDGMKSNTITITYKAPAVTSVNVSAKASEYEYGYKLTKSDLTVTAKYADNSSKTVTDYTISQSGTSLYVTFDGMKSNTITITYKAPVVKSVSVTANASEYKTGYALTKNDLTVTAKYSDKSTKTVTDYIISQSGTSLYVTFDGVKSNTITITYKAVVLTSVIVSANASEYNSGYKLTKSDLTVTAKYSDNTSKAVIDYTITQSGTSLYVTFSGMKSNTITIKYKVTMVSITLALKADEYEEGYLLSTDDLIVTAHYSDGSTKELLGNEYMPYMTGNSLYVTYGSLKSNTVTVKFVKPKKTVDYVTVSTYAYDYEEGTILTKDDLYVHVFYTDGTSINNFKDFTFTQNGTSLYVTVDGVNSETITIKIKPPAVTSVNIQLKDTQYEEGYMVDTYDLIVTAYYSNGTSSVVDIVTSDITHLTGAVYVTYQGVQSNTATYTVVEPQVARVPFLLGMTFDQAKAELEALGLVAEYAGEVYDPMIAAGEVCEQSHTSGSLLRKGNKVYLTISKGKDPGAYVIAVNISLRSDDHYVGDTITLDDLNVTAIFSDGSMQSVSDGVTLLDKTNGGYGPTGGITLTENGEHYAAVTYAGVESETIGLPCKTR